MPKREREREREGDGERKKLNTILRDKVNIKKRLIKFKAHFF